MGVFSCIKVIEITLMHENTPFFFFIFPFFEIFRGAFAPFPLWHRPWYQVKHAINSAKYKLCSVCRKCLDRVKNCCTVGLKRGWLDLEKGIIYTSATLAIISLS